MISRADLTVEQLEALVAEHRNPDTIETYALRLDAYKLMRLASMRWRIRFQRGAVTAQEPRG